MARLSREFPRLPRERPRLSREFPRQFSGLQLGNPFVIGKPKSRQLRGLGRFRRLDLDILSELLTFSLTT